jgi:serine/threonine protein kinase
MYYIPSNAVRVFNIVGAGMTSDRSDDDPTGSYHDHDGSKKATKAIRSVPNAPGDVLIGQTIGHYKIRRAIASGGMGTVYEAMQESPRRTVALKVMKRGIA